MSKLEVNAIEPQSGTTLTLGESGDTITVPSGATLDASNATLTLPDDSVTTAKLAYDPNPFRNIVINGDMQIAQRSTSVASITAGGYYTLDRWLIDIGSLGTWTMSQSTDVPTGQGFASSLKLDCTTADASPSAADYLILLQKFEGQNLQYLKKGTANASPLTASFWVKSTKTGTFIVDLRDTDNARSISKSYTVIASNTWEKKTITFEGDTTGTLNNDNGNSLQLNFWLGAGTTYTSGTLATTWGTRIAANIAVGQVNIADNTANDFLITGVQLEAGSQASGFEFMPFDIDLMRCQRYYYLHVKRSGSFEPLGMGYYYSSTDLIFFTDFKVEMRTDPSLTAGSGVDYYRFDRNNSNDLFNSLTLSISYKTNALFYNNTEASGTAGMAGGCYLNNDGAYLAFDAEL
jgi:hypothetical protein